MGGPAIDRADCRRRLRLIEGQMRGLQRMVGEGQRCEDVLVQVSAVERALRSVAVGILDEHVRACVAEARLHGQEGHAEHMLAEATRALERFRKS